MYDGTNLLTAEQASELLGVNPGTVRRYARAGKLTPAMKIGKAQLFRVSDIENFQRPNRGRPSIKGAESAA